MADGGAGGESGEVTAPPDGGWVVYTVQPKKDAYEFRYTRIDSGNVVDTGVISNTKPRCRATDLGMNSFLYKKWDSEESALRLITLSRDKGSVEATLEPPPGHSFHCSGQFSPDRTRLLLSTVASYYDSPIVGSVLFVADVTGALPPNVAPLFQQSSLVEHAVFVSWLGSNALYSLAETAERSDDGVPDYTPQEIYSVDTSVWPPSEPQRLTADGLRAGMRRYLSPDGSLLLYTRETFNTFGPSFFVAGLPGEPTTPMSVDVEFSRATWAPNSSAVALEGMYDLLLAQVDNGSLAPARKVNGDLPVGGRIRDSVFSPDSTKLAFTVRITANGPYELYVANVDEEAAEPRKLVEPPALIHDLRWGPDSRCLLYTTYEDGVRKDVAVDATFTREPCRSGTMDFEPSRRMTPDQSRFLYTEELVPGDVDLFSVRADEAGPPVQLSTPSPDGNRYVELHEARFIGHTYEWVLFRDDKGPLETSGDLWIAPVDGSRPAVRISRQAVLENWIPDVTR